MGSEKFIDKFIFMPVLAVALAIVAPAARAQTPTILHDPTRALSSANLNPANPFGGAATERSPLAPRQGEAVRVYLKACCQFGYDRVALYYTTDGTEPQGSQGVGSGTTQTLTSIAGQVTFVANDFNTSPGVRDWWVATLPPNTRNFGQTIRYKASRWTQGNPASEVFNDGSATSAGALSSSYTNKLPWPGQGSFFPGSEGVGYPPIHFWKEEGVVGNGWINAMLDQNGTWFDVYYPGAGGVQGVGTKNEGYVSGLDTFPPGLPIDNRGQMHLNQVQLGIAYNGITRWLSNQNGTDYTNIQQTYLPGTNTIQTTSTLAAGGANLQITQYDFAPRNVADGLGNPIRNLVIKRVRLTNPNASPRTVNIYLYGDFAINGGDGFDAMFADTPRGAMVAYDNTRRVVSNTGSIGFGQEYNPTTFPGYEKNVSVYLAGALRRTSAAGTGAGPATDSWRDSSPDNGQGWIGMQVTIPPGGTEEVTAAIIGGFDNFAGATGTYASQIAPTLDWFQSANLESAMNTTNTSWQSFLAAGVTVDTPDDSIDALYQRGILGTMLHFDEKTGGLIAGFRNGAYPYVWPRDMAWAAVTLSRTGHTGTVRQMTRYLRDLTFREFESWGRRGFWKQKYSTDGFVIWGAPQVDETAVIPWMINYNYKVEGDLAYLTEAQATNPGNTNYAIVKDAAIAMSQTSGIDPGRLNLRQAYPGAPAGQVLMYSNNIWEDSYDTFLMSNANIIRGLRDAREIALTLGQSSDAADFQNRENGLLPGFYGKLDWDGVNTDISLLGITYPFEVVPPNDPRAARVADRINGVRTRFNNAEGQAKPLVRFAGQHINDSSDYVGLIDRYWGDGYWANPALGPTGAGPWFLSTMWYGCFYAVRQDYTPGTADIDNHLYRLKRAMDHNGPLGFGAEQMAPSNSLQYPGQSDFTLQTAWPNAWESMSFYADSVMIFLGYEPDAPGNTLRIKPRLPGAWNTMTYNNVRVGGQRANITVKRDANGDEHTITKRTNGALAFRTVVRIPAGVTPCQVLVDGVRVAPVSIDTAIGAVTVAGQLPLANGAARRIRVDLRSPADVAGPGQTIGGDRQLTADDIIVYLNWFFAADGRADVAGPGQSVGPDGQFTADDIIVFLNGFFAGCV